MLLCDFPCAVNVMYHTALPSSVLRQTPDTNAAMPAPEAGSSLPEKSAFSKDVQGGAVGGSSMSADMPSVVGDAPIHSIEISGDKPVGSLDPGMASGSVEMPSGDVDVKAPEAETEGDGSSLIGGLVSGVAATAGAAGAAVGLSGTDDGREEVRIKFAWSLRRCSMKISPRTPPVSSSIPPIVVCAL